MLFLNESNPNPRKLNEILNILNNGGIIVYPSDTVFCIGCLINQAGAVKNLKQILKIKNNSTMLGFLCKSASEISEYGIVTQPVFKAIKNLFPGQFTFLLNSTSITPKLLQCKKKRVAIGIPDDPFLDILLPKLSAPLISSTICDDNGEIINDPDELEDMLGNQIDEVIITERILSFEFSTVIDFTGNSPEIVRQGCGDASRLFG